MNELTLTELDMGFSIPKILHASKPSVDHQGRKKITLGVFFFFLHFCGCFQDFLFLSYSSHLLILSFPQPVFFTFHTISPSYSSSR